MDNIKTLDSRRGLDRITVNLIPKASRALASAMGRNGDSKTDTVNRALQLYEFVTRLEAEGGTLYVRGQDGTELERIQLL